MYSSYSVSGPPIASSEAIFVHNNSKHGRRTPAYGREAALVGDGKIKDTFISNKRDMVHQLAALLIKILL